MYANSYIGKANMPTLDLKMAEDIARAQAKNDEGFLVDSFIAICKFLDDNPDRLSLTATKREKAEGFKPSVYERSTLEKLAKKHFSGYRKSDVPTHPSTVPDPAVSNVLSSTLPLQLSVNPLLAFTSTNWEDESGKYARLQTSFK